ncbi:DUF305 domain-containing protein [Streptomyces djakartensis]|uniref:DUF305 domain-containing protein n=1 Tax=Streptomyces djakartensis TaxID=68193 RepID=UPI0034DFD629
MNRIRTLTRRAALGVATAAVALVLAACGDGGAAGPGAGGAGRHAAAHNAQDVAFAQGMIPHHRQALEMARLADGRASSGAVEDLARRIEKGQDPEIRTMTGWLTSWGEEAPGAAAGGGHHSGTSHAGMPGMMSDGDLAGLERITGKAFDAAFLTLMVKHHEGAVDMAGTERAEGRYGPARAMADAIVTAQKAEIAEMKRLLADGGR